jgi:hypothetical protein
MGVVLRGLLETVQGLLGPVGSGGAAAVRALGELAAALTSDAGALALVAATATFALLALLAVAVSLVRSPAHAVDPSAAHPRRAIHDATRLTETHPDAPGHARPRAPGFAALAA